MKNKSIGGCVLSNQPDQQKRLQCKIAQKGKQLSNIENFFLTRFAHSSFYKIHISGAANRYAPVQYAKYVVVVVVVFFFQSSHHDTNLLLYLYHFRKNIIIYWLILTVNHQGSYFPFFYLHPVGQTFLYSSKFCNHLKHSAK